MYIVAPLRRVQTSTALKTYASPSFPGCLHWSGYLLHDGPFAKSPSPQLPSAGWMRYALDAHHEDRGENSTGAVFTYQRWKCVPVSLLAPVLHRRCPSPSVRFGSRRSCTYRVWCEAGKDCPTTSPAAMQRFCNPSLVLGVWAPNFLCFGG